MSRYIVFISSTIEDLAKAREAVEKSLQTLDVFEPRRVEKLPAIPEPSRAVCLEEVRKADAVLLIVGKRYGFVPTVENPEALSVTHLEFREARKKGKPVFAFILRAATREEDVKKLLKEVENFDEGVFRKEWETAEALAIEARRSLLWWIAKLARVGISGKVTKQTIARKLDFETIGGIAFHIESSIDSTGSLPPWIENLFSDLQGISAQELLPPLVRKDRVAAVGELSQIVIRLMPLAQSHYCHAEIRCVEVVPSGELPNDTQRGATLLALSVEIQPGDAGTSLLELLVRACMHSIAENPGQSVKLLLEALQNPGIAERSKGALLGAAADLNLRFGLEHALLIGQRLLDLDEITSDAMYKVTMSLFATSCRFHSRGASRAKLECDRLQFDLLLKGLTADAVGAEAIYSIARQTLIYAPESGIRLYEELLKFDAFYEERWYWHRDLGIAYYSKGAYREAAAHYERAVRLKPKNSELYRFAGDAYFYEGRWALALERYESALSIEPAEAYFLDTKIAFLRQKLSCGIHQEKLHRFRRSIAASLSSLASGPADWNFVLIAKPLFRLAHWVCPLDWESARWLALFANRKGRYGEAIKWLQFAVYFLPESPSTRLNLAANMIFVEGGKWTQHSRIHAKVASFHGGSDARERFRLLLTNTPTRDLLIKEFDDVLFEQVKKEREAWQQRRQVVLGPEKFGEVIHVEFRE
jgi:tetratricopeptide (TPR) repeat protein